MTDQAEAAATSVVVSETTRIGVVILATALVLGVIWDQLAIVWPIGLGLALAVLCLAVATLVAARLASIDLTPAAWLLAPISVLAVFLAVRDSGTLIALNLLVIALCGALLGHRFRGGSVHLDSLSDYAFAGILSGLWSCGGVFVLAITDLKWRELSGFRWSRVGLPLLRGLLIAVPLVLVFGLLFVSADPAFERVVKDVLRIDLDALIRDAFLSLVIAWLVAGPLRQALLARIRPSLHLQCPSSFGLGGLEIAIVLGLLDLLFLSFVIVQFQWFFGGSALVASSATLTYSEYARRGFNELVAVSALVLPLLLVADWLLRRDRSSDLGLFRALASVLIVLLFVVMVSAVNRMLLYQAAYGLTEQRLYPTAFMLWLAVAFVWFAATVLSGRRDRFAFGMLTSGLLVTLALNVMNPDALIVRVNSARATASTSFDSKYALQLSADAVPALVEALPRLSPVTRAEISKALSAKWQSGSPDFWRSWQLGRWSARQAVSESEIVKGLVPR